VDTTKFCSLKKRTLQRFCNEKAHTTNFVIEKCGHCKACNKQREHYKDFVMKKRTLQTFVMEQGGHYKVL
jgi:7-cyano-7-deazaguanine synthase in queuosine biosynthesis